MSNGALCNAKIKAAVSINSHAGDIFRCNQYKGHEGKHSCMFFCVKKSESGDWDDNYRLGGPEWGDELSIKNN